MKGWRHRIQHIYDSFPQDFWEGALILDVGSSNGRKGLQQYISRGAKSSNCTAVDVVEKFLIPLRDMGCNCVAIDLEETSIQDIVSGFFDLIICSHLLEHITEDCESRLIEYFLNAGKNIVICYPKKVKNISKRRYGHKRTLVMSEILYRIGDVFDDVVVKEVENQILIIAKNNRNIK